jgi:hypothetical protein
VEKKTLFVRKESCTGNLGYPFKNKRVKSDTEKLACYVDKMARYLRQTGLNFIDNLQIIYENCQALVIVTHIWQKLSSIEHKMALLVTHFWQLFPQIFGETVLVFPSSSLCMVLD